jgi:signal transduction histidine kinase
MALGRRLDPDQLEVVADLARDCGGRAGDALGLSPLARSDREDLFAAWLDDHAVADPYDLAAALVDAGLATTDLDAVAAEIPADALADALAWLGAALASDALAGEIEQSAARISDLVRAIKGYSYMDRAPEQEVDVREGLEVTLKILAYKLRGITVERDYAPDLPRVTAYAGALNQVWTNLLDNAIDALKAAATPDPRIRIRAAPDGDGVLVEIADNGPGIPPAVQGRLFEPFFTTKPVGDGTGLGLDTAYRVVVRDHGGDLRFTSAPGATRFTVRLPLDGTKASDAAASLAEDTPGQEAQAPSIAS